MQGFSLRRRGPGGRSGAADEPGGRPPWRWLIVAGAAVSVGVAGWLIEGPASAVTAAATVAAAAHDMLP